MPRCCFQSLLARMLLLLAFCCAGLLNAQYDIAPPQAPQSGQQYNYTPSGYQGGGERLYDGRSQYKISPQDLIEMKIFQEPDMDSRARVEADGNVILPLLGRVKIGGLTVLEAQEYVQALYNADYYVEPQVTILVLEYRERKIQVIGQVIRPGWIEIPLGEELTLSVAISAAGGFNLRANKKEVQVTRKTRGGRSDVTIHNVKEILDNPKVKDPLLNEGDTVFVKQSTI